MAFLTLVEFCLSQCSGGVDVSLHLPQPSILSRFNQTEPATFSILLFWTFFRSSIFFLYFIKHFLYIYILQGELKNTSQPWWDVRTAANFVTRASLQIGNCKLTGEYIPGKSHSPARSAGKLLQPKEIYIRIWQYILMCSDWFIIMLCDLFKNLSARSEGNGSKPKEFNVHWLVLFNFMWPVLSVEKDIRVIVTHFLYFFAYWWLYIAEEESFEIIKC